MLLPLITTAALLTGAHADTIAQTPPTGSVRVWLPDTVLSVGALGRAYVQVQEAGHLALLHVEPSGRIRVLFPARPSDDDVVPAGATFVVGGVGDSATFRVASPGAGTLLAIRSWTPLHYEALRAGDQWDYAHALLLQPTAGIPLAALLDIADRLADGEAYVYDVAEYRTPGAVVAKRTPPDSVCFSCLAARHTGLAAAGAAGAEPAGLEVDQSAADLPGTYVVDCSDATVDNALCGVQDNRSYTTVQQPEVAQPVSYAYPLYLPLFIGNRRLHRLPRGAPPPPAAIALNLHRIPGQIVPPPRRRVAPIVVQQPRAPSRPWRETAPAAPATPGQPPSVPTGRVPARIVVINAPTPAVPTAGVPLRFRLPAREPALAAPMPHTAPSATAGARAAFGQAPRPIIVPRR
jgi:hypothetical protein